MMRASCAQVMFEHLTLICYKIQANQGFQMVPPGGIEPTTSALPRMNATMTSGDKSDRHTASCDTRGDVRHAFTTPRA